MVKCSLIKWILLIQVTPQRLKLSLYVLFDRQHKYLGFWHDTTEKTCRFMQYFNFCIIIQKVIIKTTQFIHCPCTLILVKNHILCKKRNGTLIHPFPPLFQPSAAVPVDSHCHSMVSAGFESFDTFPSGKQKTYVSAKKFHRIFSIQFYLHEIFHCDVWQHTVAEHYRYVVQDRKYPAHYQHCSYYS